MTVGAGYMEERIFGFETATDPVPETIFSLIIYCRSFTSTGLVLLASDAGIIYCILRITLGGLFSFLNASKASLGDIRFLAAALGGAIVFARLYPESM